MYRSGGLSAWSVGRECTQGTQAEGAVWYGSAQGGGVYRVQRPAPGAGMQGRWGLEQGTMGGRAEDQRFAGTEQRPGAKSDRGGGGHLQCRGHEGQ